VIEYLDVEELVHLVERLGAGPVRDLGLLDAAAARARSSAFGEDAYPTLELKAAALMHSLCRNHPLVDGNKRLALLATGAFLRLNGRRFRMDQDAAFELVMAVADGSIDVPEIAARLTEGPE
jgi:death-on-curing protein